MWTQSTKQFGARVESKSKLSKGSAIKEIKYADYQCLELAVDFQVYQYLLFAILGFNFRKWVKFWVKNFAIDPLLDFKPISKVASMVRKSGNTFVM
ncbi:hypothetical protein ES708_14884 [subsurface metagenome]